MDKMTDYYEYNEKSEKRKENMLMKRLKTCLFGVMLTTGLMVGCSSPEANPSTEIQISIDSSVSSQETIRLEEMDRKIDWKDLEKQNKDIYAWVSIPNTTVDYPVLQADETKDDYYYLNRNIKEEEDIFGSIFTERYNDAGFTDPVTILYGHSSYMDETPKGKEMFTDLHKYESQEYLDQNPDLFIYTPNGALHYEIFCASVFDDRYILGSYGFVDPAEVDLFIKDLESTKEHWVNEKIERPEGSKYLVLSTCQGVNTEKRRL